MDTIKLMQENEKMETIKLMQENEKTQDNELSASSSSEDEGEVWKEYRDIIFSSLNPDKSQNDQSKTLIEVKKEDTFNQPNF